MWEARVAGSESADASSLPPGCEVYASYDGPARRVVLSHWADEEALAAYAGSSWRTDASAEAVAFGGSVTEPHVWHFTRL